MRNLTKEAESLVRSTQQPATPQMMLLAMLALLATAPEGRANNYWAYVPDPPLLQPASWSHPEIGVYTNCTWALGGFSSAHIRPVKEGNFTYQGLSEARPICFALAGVVLLGLMLLPCITRLLIRDVSALQVAMHKLYLHSKPKELEVTHRV